ncbi:hypothetical protein WMY93_020601 [Mugilogobius chulae]|uniref:Uncharacterized protein n=1 Tax=Mugilogobius chulae TaxID=88201 RepID=A0AAW0NE48_9GOBI
MKKNRSTMLTIKERNLAPVKISPLNLNQTTRKANPAPAPAKTALINARSLVNKTYILKDFIVSRDLDFLCVTETWIGIG